MKLRAMAAVFAMCLGASSANAAQLGIGTMGQGTSGYSMGSAIAKVLSDNGIDALVQPSSGTSSYLPLIQMGELDLGIASAIEVGDAVHGNGDFKGKALDKIAPVARLFPIQVGIFVKNSSGMKTVADLKGHSLTSGYTSQVTIQRILDALLAAGGISSSDVKPVLVPNVLRGADDFSSGRADAAFFAVGSGKVSEVDASVGGLHFLALPDTPDAEKRMKAVVPESYISMANPAPNMTGISQPTPVMTYDYMLVAGKHVPDATVEKIIEILKTHKKDLVAAFKTFKNFDPDHMYLDFGVPYHEGAMKALKVSK